jgi:hypothetical protein
MKSTNPAPDAEPVNITEPTRIPLLPAEQKTLNLLAAVQNYPEVIDIRELARQADHARDPDRSTAQRDGLEQRRDRGIKRRSGGEERLTCHSINRSGTRCSGARRSQAKDLCWEAYAFSFGIVALSVAKLSLNSLPCCSIEV